jgi:DNA-binding MarR family transcriptional regulator
MIEEMVTSVREEILQRKPFKSLGQEVAIDLLRTADVVRHRLGTALAAYGITGPQYNVLRILRGAGDEGLCTLAVAQRLIERAPGITRMLDRLEAKGWVRRERSATDRREVRCYLTAAGHALLAETDEAVEQADAKTVTALTEPESRQLIELLDRLRSGLR